ncbi:hypothetical protein DyAD56_18760 [Dyella sp. AD56]|nr:hypothetical protein DyAD56_18760 [Dyella sp. AD56]
MNPTESFSIHDLTSFPLVRMKDGAAMPGYAAQWAKEMDALLSLSRPFVMLHGSSEGGEAHEDRKGRGLWLKRHKEELGRYCLAMIGIEADPLKRQAMKAMSAMATKAFGTPTYVVESDDEAVELANRLLGAFDVQEVAGDAR